MRLVVVAQFLGGRRECEVNSRLLEKDRVD